MFYDRFLKLCELKGVTPVQVRNDLNISQSTMASWKSRGLTPNAKKLHVLAEYFGVSVSNLLSDSEKISEALDIAAHATYPDLTGKTVRFDQLTEVDEQLLDLGGFSALAEFTFLSEDDKKEALKDIKKFVEFTLSKYQKDKEPPQPE